MQIEPTQAQAHAPSFDTMTINGGYSRFNVDGFLRYAQYDARRIFEYCQVFRSGVIESVTTELISDETIYGTEIEMKVLKSLEAYLGGLQALGVPTPVVVSLTLTGVRGCTMLENTRLKRARDPTPVDREMLVLPDALLNPDDEDIVAKMKEVFDAMWNAAGWPGSPNYAPDGTWTAAPLGGL